MFLASYATWCVGFQHDESVKRLKIIKKVVGTEQKIKKNNCWSSRPGISSVLSGLQLDCSNNGFSTVLRLIYITNSVIMQLSFYSIMLICLLGLTQSEASGIGTRAWCSDVSRLIKRETGPQWVHIKYQKHSLHCSECWASCGFPVCFCPRKHLVSPLPVSGRSLG